MGHLTNNIHREEMACKCGCGFDIADYELLTVVQDSADFFLHRDHADKVMIIVTSGNRCPAHNRTVPGASANSQHQYGKAIDYKLKTYVGGEWRFIGAHELAEFLDSKYPDKYGIGLYSKGRVHLDIRKTKSRWRG